MYNDKDLSVHLAKQAPKFTPGQQCIVIVRSLSGREVVIETSRRDRRHKNTWRYYCHLVDGPTGSNVIGIWFYEFELISSPTPFEHVT